MYNALIVDDEPRTAEALNKKVNWRNCGIRKTFLAESMREAIKIIEKEKIEILICDIEMPNGSGLQLLEWLHEHDIEVYCVFLTCHPEFSYMRKAIQLRCYDYILKPVDYEAFEDVISELIRKIEILKTGAEVSNITKWTGLSDGETPEFGEKREQDLEMRVKKYIYEHLVDDLTITQIAENLHFNPQYLMRTFKKSTDMSIVEYITKCRIDTAKKILRDTNLPVKEVASMVGYSDYTYFNRVFKKEVGDSPNKYRGRIAKSLLST